MGGCDYVTNHNLKYFPENYANQEDILKGDGVFVLDSVNSRDLYNYNKLANDDFFKLFYKNSDIKRYHTNTDTTKRIIFSASSSSEVVKTKIKDILAKYSPLLKKIRRINNEKESDWYLLRRGTAHPYIFEGEKIVCPQRSNTNTFGYNDKEWYASADVYYITNPQKGVSLKYILGLLNSKLYYYWLYNKGKRKGEALELYQKPLSEIPIKLAIEEEQCAIVSYVDRILSVKKEHPLADTSAEEHEIDRLVYQLYGLTNAEVKIIDPNETTTGADDELFKA